MILLFWGGAVVLPPTGAGRPGRRRRRADWTVVHDLARDLAPPDPPSLHETDLETLILGDLL